MSEDFKREIRDIAAKAKIEAGQGGSEIGSTESGGKFIEVLEEFFKISREGINTFNECLEQKALAVHRLPADFLDLFLGITGRRAGFSIVSHQKLAVFFDEDPDTITVIGKLRNNNSEMQANIGKTFQLIKISFISGERGYVYKDNTGKALEAEEVVALIIRWLVSGKVRV
jgi:hypothetical protein